MGFTTFPLAIILDPTELIPELALSLLEPFSPIAIINPASDNFVSTVTVSLICVVNLAVVLGATFHCDFNHWTCDFRADARIRTTVRLDHGIVVFFGSR